MSRPDLPALSVAELQSLLRRREISPREVLDALGARIADVDGKIDAYLSIDFEAAAREAEKADVDLPLGGVPIAIKDIISVAGQPCTCASKSCVIIARRTTPPSFANYAPRAQFHSAKQTWTSLPWDRPRKTRASS